MQETQLTLIIGLIVMALINASSLVWAFYLNQKLRNKPVPKIYDVHVEGTKIFTPTDMAAIEEQAMVQLQKASEQAAGKIQASINSALSRVADHVDEMTTTTLNAEFQKYQISLQALREQTIAEFTKLQQELDGQRNQLMENLEKQVALEREKRLAQFNSRLNDVVSGYIAESLGSQVDLGSQMVAILQKLQEHKEQIKKDILT